MKGVGRAGEAIDAAMLTAAEGVDRAVEADVGRIVARQDRLGMLDRDCGPALGNSVERLDLVEPVTLLDALFQVEARRRGIAGRPASVVRLDRHCANLPRASEHN